jgi:hypothetical protein
MFPVLAAKVLCAVMLGASASDSGERGGTGRKPAPGAFRAGAAAVDVSPTRFPVTISGGLLPIPAQRVARPLYARSLVLDDGAMLMAITVVDTLFIPREMCDRIKRAAAAATGIAAERILIAATHTHSAPSLSGALGSGESGDYAREFPGRVTRSIVEAAQNRVPARAGWAVVEAPQHTHCRQWILRPDRVRYDPFGELSVRSQMHPGYQNPDFLGPAGPAEPGLTLLALCAKDGRPLAWLANYSMHYFYEPPVSSDYFGAFCKAVEARIGRGDPARPFVAILSQGTAGDQHWMDYGRPAKNLTLEDYTRQMVELAMAAHATIRYRDAVPLGMAQTQLVLDRRVPDASRLAWARGLLAGMGGRPPHSWSDVYAGEQVSLHQEPRVELVLQAIRVGDLGITAIPCEVFGITGLKLKAQSPFVPTMNIELANGSEGYIPPPEQHRLGGYTTWPARSAGLEVQAEPKIVEAALGLLERVSGRRRRPAAIPAGPYARSVLASSPLFYWRLGEFQGVQASDASGHGRQGTREGGIALYLEGPPSPGFCGPGYVHRAVHLAGGRIRTAAKDSGDRYTVELWFSNLLPADSRAVAGHLFSNGPDSLTACPGGEHLALGGRQQAPGQLLFYAGAAPQPGLSLSGRTTIAPGGWHYVALVRDGQRAAVYLDGNPSPEIDGQLPPQPPGDWLFFGGRGDNQASWEGKLAEIAFYARPLPPAEIAAHYRAAGQ